MENTVIRGILVNVVMNMDSGAKLPTYHFVLHELGQMTQSLCLASSTVKQK